jgi:hypothetical protein
MGLGVETRCIASLLFFLSPLLLSAQNGVTVSDLAISAGTVTFHVSWDRDAMPVALWSDSVWVFVDYNNAGEMKRLPVSSATASAGTVIQIPGNDKGVWVVGNARSAGSFSATVTLLTATATATGACVYASNYPPVGIFVRTSDIRFTGTPPYELVLEDGYGKPQTLSVSSTFTVPDNYTLASFIDKTGAPGRIIPHTYCMVDPGVIGNTTTDVLPGCTVYVAGEIGGVNCVNYHAGAIGGTDDVPPDCADYRAGTIGGISFAGLM